MLLLTFTVAGAHYALDVAGVIELVPRVELRAIPHAPAFLAGLLGYRGEVVPVIDLGLLLGSSPCADRLSTRIILVKSVAGGQNQGGEPRDSDRGGVRLIALIAEQLSDLVEVGAEQVVPAPVHLPQAPYLDTIARTDRGFVPMIAVAKLSLVLGPSSFVLGGPAQVPGDDEKTPVECEPENEQVRLGTKDQ
jgi:chemotaxis-related protein WspB